MSITEPSNLSLKHITLAKNSTYSSDQLIQKLISGMFYSALLMLKPSENYTSVEELGDALQRLLPNNFGFKR